MSEHLDKARAALAHAADLDPSKDVEYGDLLAIAAVQARVAMAGALERLADAAELLTISAS